MKQIDKIFQRLVYIFGNEHLYMPWISIIELKPWLLLCKGLEVAGYHINAISFEIKDSRLTAVMMAQTKEDSNRNAIRVQFVAEEMKMIIRQKVTLEKVRGKGGKVVYDKRIIIEGGELHPIAVIRQLVAGGWIGKDEAGAAIEAMEKVEMELCSALA